MNYLQIIPQSKQSTSGLLTTLPAGDPSDHMKTSMLGIPTRNNKAIGAGRTLSRDSTWQPPETRSPMVEALF